MDPRSADDERFPLLDDRGRALLGRLREHPHAPRFTFPCGDRLTRERLGRVEAFAASLAEPRGWSPGELPGWLPGFAAAACRDVPFYRRYGEAPRDFHALPTLDRDPIRRAPWDFVPDSQPVEGLVVYFTSGTTGPPLDVLAFPEVAAMYLPILRAALAEYGVALEGGPDRVAILFACFQHRTYTYAAVSTYLGQAGHVKVNLNPAEWRDPGDRTRFLDDCAPEIYTGDPLSFAELAALPLRRRPKALVSSAAALLPGMRVALEKRFDCPVLDLYSTCETGPIGITRPGEDGLALPHGRIYVELLGPDGAPVPPGERGEVTVSGGFNPLLPLLRYRTGDWARQVYRGGRPVLLDLEGRAPLVFTAAGRAIPTIDISTVLKPFPLSAYTCHQAADGAVHLRVRGAAVDADGIRAAVRSLFGADHPVSVEESESLEPEAGKSFRYSREGAAPLTPAAGRDRGAPR